MTDDECIALAMLHGCAFHCEADLGLWYTGVAGDPAIHDAHKRDYGSYGFRTRKELARVYCEFYKLLPEVT
jgi:nicotinamide mononucleotide (NMN) deamidase PncC